MIYKKICSVPHATKINWFWESFLSEFTYEAAEKSSSLWARSVLLPLNHFFTPRPSNSSEKQVYNLTCWTYADERKDARRHYRWYFDTLRWGLWAALNGGLPRIILGPAQLLQNLSINISHLIQPVRFIHSPKTFQTLDIKLVLLHLTNTQSFRSIHLCWFHLFITLLYFLCKIFTPDVTHKLHCTKKLLPPLPYLISISPYGPQPLQIFLSYQLNVSMAPKTSPVLVPFTCCVFFSFIPLPS